MTDDLPQSPTEPDADSTGNEDDPGLTRNELKDLLRQLMTLGLPAARPEDVPCLLALHAVRARAVIDEPPATLAALHQLIRELVSGTRPELLRRLAPYAFGTYTTADQPLKDRLASAGRIIGLTWEALRRTHLDRLASNFADRLYILESRYRYNKWLERPVDERLHDETLRQYDFYTAMSLWIESAANDAQVALNARADDEADGFTAFAESAFWRWVKFLRHAFHYQIEFRGAWNFRIDSTADLDEAIRSVWDAEASPPMTPRDRSWLRVELLGALLEEMDPFLESLERQERGRKLLAEWKAWLELCRCSLDQADDECAVHQWIEDAHTFFAIINEEVGEPHQTDRAARYLTLPDPFLP